MVFCHAAFHLLEEQDVDQRTVMHLVSAEEVVNGDAEIGFDVLVELIPVDVVPVVSSLARIMLDLIFGEINHFNGVPVVELRVPPHDLTVLDILCPGT